MPAAACAAAALAAQALTGDSPWWFSLLVVGGAGVAAYVLVAPVALTGQERSAMQRRGAQDHEPVVAVDLGQPGQRHDRAGDVRLVLEVEQHVRHVPAASRSSALLLRTSPGRRTAAESWRRPAVSIFGSARVRASGRPTA